MTKEVQAEVVTTRDLVKLAEKYEDTTAKDLELMHNTVAKGTNLTEFRYFLNVSRASGLNPFLKEIWCYKDNKGNQIIFAGRDGFLKKAQQNPDFAGIRSAEVRVNDEFEIDIANGKVKHKVTTLDDSKRGDIVGAYAIAFRKDGEPTIEVVSWATYNKANSTYTPWKTHPAEMIKKVAEVHALKKAFGISELQMEEDFNIRGDKVLPLGTEVSNKKIEDGQIVSAISEVYKNMLKRIELAHTEMEFKRLRTDIDKQIALNLLTPEAIEDLNIKYESKLNQFNKDGK